MHRRPTGWGRRKSWCASAAPATLLQRVCKGITDNHVQWSTAGRRTQCCGVACTGLRHDICRRRQCHLGTPCHPREPPKNPNNRCCPPTGKGPQNPVGRPHHGSTRKYTHAHKQPVTTVSIPAPHHHPACLAEQALRPDIQLARPKAESGGLADQYVQRGSAERSSGTCAEPQISPRTSHWLLHVSHMVFAQRPSQGVRGRASRW
jgi:hypothetical protein